jgi:diaminopimelate epimerase
VNGKRCFINFMEEKGMDQKKKLSVVIEHWIEHNESHMGEYKKWAQKAGELGFDSAKAEIEEAMGKISQSNQHLEEALKAISP